MQPMQSKKTLCTCLHFFEALITHAGLEEGPIRHVLYGLSSSCKDCLSYIAAITASMALPAASIALALSSHSALPEALHTP